MLKLYFHFVSGMPYSFRQAGLGLGIIILTLVAIISGKFLQFCNLFSEMHDSKIPETSTVVVIECNLMYARINPWRNSHSYIFKI